MLSLPFLSINVVEVCCFLCHCLNLMQYLETNNKNQLFIMLGNKIMLYPSLSKLSISLLLSLSLVACGDNEAPSASSNETSGQVAAVQETRAEGVVAQVGDQNITYNEIGVLLNSSAMGGLSIPALGSPDRYKVMVTLLDKLISTNLLYLDAKAKGTDRQTAYTSGMKKFEDAVLVTASSNFFIPLV